MLPAPYLGLGYHCMPCCAICTWVQVLGVTVFLGGTRADGARKLAAEFSELMGMSQIFVWALTPRIAWLNLLRIWIIECQVLARPRCCASFLCPGAMSKRR